MRVTVNHTKDGFDSLPYSQKNKWSSSSIGRAVCCLREGSRFKSVGDRHKWFISSMVECYIVNVETRDQYSYRPPIINGEFVSMGDRWF